MDLIVRRIDELVAPVGLPLEKLPWATTREFSRALVRRIEAGFEQVQVGFRVDSFSGESDPEKQSLQPCRRSSHTPL